MPLRIVRNDITKMNTQAIVNTANEQVTVGPGCDKAVYDAAGFDELLAYRKEKIGSVPEGEAFITPGFKLQAEYIIHAVSPLYKDGNQGEEEKLRSCYRKSLELANENHIRSVAFPLISTGSFGYPKEEGMRIAADEINAFLLENEMLIYIVVFDEKATELGSRLYPGLEEYIDREYVDERKGLESAPGILESVGRPKERNDYEMRSSENSWPDDKKRGIRNLFRQSLTAGAKKDESPVLEEPHFRADVFFGRNSYVSADLAADSICDESEEAVEGYTDSKLEERLQHLSDTFSEYLLYLIEEKEMDSVEVYKRAIVDKKTFSKLRNDPNYHPNKLTALCLCVGAQLNLDETKDLLARAGYALSPCDKTDIIFSYFIENEMYDMIELDIQLEEHGQRCIIS